MHNFFVQLYSGNCYCIEDGMKAEQMLVCLSWCVLPVVLSVWVDVYFQLCCMCYCSDIITLTVMGAVVMWQRSGSLCVVSQHCHGIQSDYSTIPVYFTGWTKPAIDICTYLVLGMCTVKVRSHFHHLSLLLAQLYGPAEDGLHVHYVLNCSKIWYLGTNTKTLLVADKRGVGDLNMYTLMNHFLFW